MNILNRASNLIYSLRHETINDDLELIDVYEILKNSMEIVQEQAKEKDIVLIN